MAMRWRPIVPLVLHHPSGDRRVFAEGGAGAYALYVLVPMPHSQIELRCPGAPSKKAFEYEHHVERTAARPCAL
jgi:hypothetical protein